MSTSVKPDNLDDIINYYGLKATIYSDWLELTEEADNSMISPVLAHLTRVESWKTAYGLATWPWCGDVKKEALNYTALARQRQKKAQKGTYPPNTILIFGLKMAFGSFAGV